MTEIKRRRVATNGIELSVLEAGEVPSSSWCTAFQNQLTPGDTSCPHSQRRVTTRSRPICEATARVICQPTSPLTISGTSPTTFWD